MITSQNLFLYSLFFIKPLLRAIFWLLTSTSSLKSLGFLSSWILAEILNGYWDMMPEVLKNGKKSAKIALLTNSKSEFWTLGMLPKWFSSMNQQKCINFCFFQYIFSTVKFLFEKERSAQKITKSAFLKLEVWIFKYNIKLICEPSLIISDWSDKRNGRQKIGKVGGCKSTRLSLKG